VLGVCCLHGFLDDILLLGGGAAVGTGELSPC
jgi:hypothetical protein